MTAAAWAQGVDQMGFVVSDIEESMAYWAGVLSVGPWFYLRWEDRPGAAFVVLGQHLSRPVGGGATGLQELGFDHVAFDVDDVDAVLSRAREMGVDILTGPKVNDGPSYGYPGEARIKTALMYDPERNIIQIDQWL